MKFMLLCFLSPNLLLKKWNQLLFTDVTLPTLLNSASIFLFTMLPPRGQPSSLYWPSEDAPPSSTGWPRGTGRKEATPPPQNHPNPLGWAALGTRRGRPVVPPSWAPSLAPITLCPGTPGEGSRNHRVSLGLVPAHSFSAQNENLREFRN